MIRNKKFCCTDYALIYFEETKEYIKTGYKIDENNKTFLKIDI